MTIKQKTAQSIPQNTTYAIIGAVHSETSNKIVYEVVRVFSTDNIEDVSSCLDQFRRSADWPGYAFSIYAKLH